MSPTITHSSFSQLTRLRLCAPNGRFLCVSIFSIVHLNMGTAIVYFHSSGGFRVNNSCEIWIHANNTLSSSGTDPGYLWQQRLQEASFYPSSSFSSSFCFSQAPALSLCYPPTRIVSTVATPGWVIAQRRVAGYPIIHSQGRISSKDGKTEGGQGCSILGWWSSAEDRSCFGWRIT